MDKFRLRQQLVAAAARAETAILYEGLPHQRFEREALEREKATRSVIGIDDYPFYDKALTFRNQDLERLRKIIGKARNYRRKAGYKLCGGYHPDYVIKWVDGEVEYRTGICFGCNEILLCTGDVASIADITCEAEKELDDILKHYWNLRPLRKQSFGSENTILALQEVLEAEIEKGATPDELKVFENLIASEKAKIEEKKRRRESNRPVSYVREQAPQDHAF